MTRTDIARTLARTWSAQLLDALHDESATEAQDQALVVSYLLERHRLALHRRAEPLLWTHPANERASASQRRFLSGQGVSPGVPDLLIFDTTRTGEKGAAIEMKRARGGSLRAEQRVWLSSLASRGYAVAVCHGVREAIAQLVEWYGTHEGATR